MKITLKDLKKVVEWIETNSPDQIIDINEEDDRWIIFKCQDRYGVQCTIKIFKDSNMLPRITKEAQLP